MSSYYHKTKHPITGKVENALWLDDYFGSHKYAVKFPNDDTYYNAEEYKLKEEVRVYGRSQGVWKDQREIIIKLTVLWYQIIATDHHKDRDCHWYINTVYSYGQAPKYRLEHYGYVWKEIEAEYSSYEEAERDLIIHLKEALEAEKKWAQEVKNNHLEYLNQGAPKNWDDDQLERAEKILQILT